MKPTQNKENNDLRPRVLCLAEGEGRHAIFFALNDFDVYCVDISSVGIEK